MLKQGVNGVVLKSYDLVEEEFGGVGMNCGGKIDVSIEIADPSPRLIVIGSGHLSSAIVRLGELVGFEITVIDPMAKKDQFPESTLVVADFPEANLPNMHISSNSYIVIVTTHKDDLPALRVALNTKASYIGLIGSRRRVVQAFRTLLH